MSAGYIKLHRSLLDWQYWDDHNTTRLLIYFLVSVNYEPKKWMGIIINPGSMVTSYEKIAAQTQLSVKQIRRSIKVLIDDNQILQERALKGQMITLVKWDELQLEEIKRADKGQAKGSERATTKEGKEIKNIKFLFHKNLITYGIDENLVEEWMQVRKAKKMVNTETAYKAVIKEIEKSKKDPNEIIQYCIERSWGGFKSDWLKNLNNNTNGNNAEKRTREDVKDNYLQNVLSRNQQ